VVEPVENGQLVRMLSVADEDEESRWLNERDLDIRDLAVLAEQTEPWGLVLICRCR
jgi:hypothetical protein